MYSLQAYYASMIGEEFNYTMHGPVKGPATKLVLLLHGYGVHAGYMDKMAERVLQDIPSAIVVCPDAPLKMNLPDEDKRANLVVPLPEEALEPPEGLDADRQLCWFPVNDSPIEMHRDVLDISEKLNRFIDEKRDAIGIQDRDVALMGFSQGGAVALYAALTRPREIGCVVGHSTVILNTEDFSVAPPALFIYGDEDRTFSEEQYMTRSIAPLQAYMPEIKINRVRGLGHTTNAASRGIASGYIAAKLNGAS